MARRVLWYAAAYTFVIIVHEAAHAATSRAFGLGTTLHHFWVDFDAAAAAPWQLAMIGLAGPVSSLATGLAAWSAYRRLPVLSESAMPLAFLAACGVSNFFGNMMSAAFLGDFSNAAKWLDVPMWSRYALSAVGAIVTAAVLFVTGRVLGQWSSDGAGRQRAVLETVVLPVLIGTGIIIAINQPNPIRGFAAARAGEAAFWVFAAAGAFTAAPARIQGTADVQLRWADAVVAALLFVAVRIMAIGLPLNG
jgi:hypothetical protein